MPAKRRFVVRRNTSFKKAQGNQGAGGNVYDPSNTGAGTESSTETTGPTFTPGSYGPWSQSTTNNAIADQQRQISDAAWLENARRTQETQTRARQQAEEEANKPKKTPEELAAEKATEKYNQNKEEKEQSIGESNEERQGEETAEAEDITQEPVNARDLKAEEQRKAQELEKAKITKEIQDKWAAKEKSDKRIAHAMTGLRLAGDVADRALGAFQSLTKLGNAFLQNPFSSPMGSAKQIFATTVVDTGAAIQGLTEDVGKLWGIKDGIKDPKDIAGTYKGAQYYKDQADIDAVQATFAKDLEYIGRDAFGDKFNGSNFGDLLTDAIDRGDIAAIDKVSKRLRETYDSDDPEIRKMREEVNKEAADRNNDAIPKERKFKASAKAKAFDTVYRKYLWGATNAAEAIGANAKKDEAAARREQTNIRTDIRREKEDAKELARQAKEMDDKSRRDFLMGQGDLGRSVALIEELQGRDAVQMDDLDADGLPRMKPGMEDNIIKALSNKKATGGTLSADETALLDALNKRRNTRRQDKADREQETADRKAEAARKRAEKAQQIKDDQARADYLMKQGLWGKTIVIAERVKGRKDVVNMTDLDEDGLPKMKESLENDIIKALSNKSVTGTLDAAEAEVLNALQTRQENRRAALEEEIEKNGGAGAYIEKLLKGNPDKKLGGSLSPETNKKIMNIAMMQTDRIRAEYIDNGGNKNDWETAKYSNPEYMKFRSYAESAKSAHDTYESMKYINKIRGASRQEKEAMGSNVTRLRKEVAKYWGPGAKVDWTNPKVQEKAEKALKKLANAKKSLRERSYRSRRGKK